MGEISGWHKANMDSAYERYAAMTRGIAALSAGIHAFAPLAPNHESTRFHPLFGEPATVFLPGRRCQVNAVVSVGDRLSDIRPGIDIPDVELSLGYSSEHGKTSPFMHPVNEVLSDPHSLPAVADFGLHTSDPDAIPSGTLVQLSREIAGKYGMPPSFFHITGTAGR